MILWLKMCKALSWIIEQWKHWSSEDLIHPFEENRTLCQCRL